MKFIKVKTTRSEDVIINLSNVTTFVSSLDGQTWVCFSGVENDIKITTPIDVFEKGLDNIDDSRNVWDFTT